MLKEKPPGRNSAALNKRVRIVHWKAAEAEPLIALCRAGGFHVEFDAIEFPALAKKIRGAPPDALVIDLTRLPSHGREVATAIRRTKYTRHIPIVFVDGAQEKIEMTRRHLPDAVFTSCSRLCASIRKAMAHPVVNPVVPPDVAERYRLRTKAQKLGIKESVNVGIVDPPRGYEAALGELPQGVELLENPDVVQRVTLWFVRTPEDYQGALRRMRAIADRTKLWVIWRKGGGSGLTDKIVREWGNEVGLVDYKICSVSDEWSGMVFARRKSLAKTAQAHRQAFPELEKR